MSQQPKVKGVADIVFLIDATGSMGPCISAVKQNIKTFVGTMTTPDPNGGAVVKDWRAQGVRDRGPHYSDHPPPPDNPVVTPPTPPGGQPAAPPPPAAAGGTAP